MEDFTLECSSSSLVFNFFLVSVLNSVVPMKPGAIFTKTMLGRKGYDEIFCRKSRPSSTTKVFENRASVLRHKPACQCLLVEKAADDEREVSIWPTDLCFVNILVLGVILIPFIGVMISAADSTLTVLAGTETFLLVSTIGARLSRDDLSDCGCPDGFGSLLSI